MLNHLRNRPLCLLVKLDPCGNHFSIKIFNPMSNSKQFYFISKGASFAFYLANRTTPNIKLFFLHKTFFLIRNAFNFYYGKKKTRQFSSCASSQRKTRSNGKQINYELLHHANQSIILSANLISPSYTKSSNSIDP
jgi:hypothetical protein